MAKGSDDRVWDLIEKRLQRIEDKVDGLQSDLDQRKGGLKMFIALFSVLGTVAGVAGSFLHDLIART